MFERFTELAQHAVVLAQEEARMLNHDYVGTEHVLLGLIHESEGVAAKALQDLGISLDMVREQVEVVVGKGRTEAPAHIPFTPRAKKVLELALREAMELGHNYIGTEHILLGILREGEGRAAQVLLKLGANLDRVREQVLTLLESHRGRREGSTERPTGLSGQWGSGQTELLRVLRDIDRRLRRIEKLLEGKDDQPDG